MSDYRTLKLALLADTSKFGTNLNKAQNQTKTFGQKVGDTAKKIGKAFAIAGAAVAGMAAKLAIDGVKAAIEDQAAQVKLATTLKNTTKASNAQIKSVEKYIDKLQRASGVADNKLRPSLERFLVATGKISKAQKLQKLAMDISAGTGKDLQTVTLALAKGYDGNLASIQRLGIGIDQTIIKNKDFKGAVAQLSETFKGQASAAAETMEGKFKRFNIAIDEAKESIGVALMPTLENMVNYLNSPKGQKVITDFAEAFADSIKIMAKYLPGVVRKVSQLVSNVSKNGLIGGLMSDPKIAIAAAAYGAGAIAGGPAGGAIAAIAAYTGAKGFEDYGKNVAGDLSGAAAQMSGNALGNLPSYSKKTLKKINNKKTNWAGGSPAEALRLMQEGKIPAPVVVNVVVNGAADSRESARAIKKTLEKIKLNGGSEVGVLGFN